MTTPIPQRVDRHGDGDFDGDCDGVAAPNALSTFEPPGGRPSRQSVLAEAARARARIEAAVLAGRTSVAFEEPLAAENAAMLAANGFRLGTRAAAAAVYPPRVEQVVSWGPPPAQWWAAWFADRRADTWGGMRGYLGLPML
jgi:hypothetical protein